MSVKRKLTQDDLRKAMSEHRKKAATVKKIESPLARYTDAGQLMCILCKSIIRSEAAWAIHLNSRVHKENIILAKKIKAETDAEPTLKTVQNTPKRPTSPSERSFPNKKIKGILKHSQVPAPHISTRLPGDIYSISNQQNGGAIPNAAALLHNLESSSVFDKDKESQCDVDADKEKEKDKGKDASHQALPEGFFDDPILDAKVRNVEYKNPIEEEWEKFQKEIKEETAQSAQIIAEDQEEATTERQLDEIEEQIRHWSRVMDLVKRKEQVQVIDRKEEQKDEDDVPSGDEAEFDEFLDWRVKNSYK